MKIDKKLIKELTDYLNEFGLSEIEYQDGNKKIKVGKNITATVTASAHKPGLIEKKIEEVGTKITSPIIISILTNVNLSTPFSTVSTRGAV